MNNSKRNDFYVDKIVFEGVEDEMINLHIHKANSSAVLIMYPGADGSIDGYNNKYIKIANLIQSKNIASVVRLDNRYCSARDLPYPELMINKIAQVVEHVINNSVEMFGHDEIEIYLSGVSAGAGAIASVLEEYPTIKKVLFVAPAESVGIDNIARGLRNYRGELFLVAGEDDEIKTTETASKYHRASPNTTRRELIVIPECDHQFSGKKNGMILSNAFLWAFSGKGNFPSHRGGMKLYE